VSPRDRLVLPLDVSSLAEAEPWVERLKGEVGVFKVGLQLFTASGPDAVRLVHDSGARCFLDLKLHDIPATVSRAVTSACALGVSYLTLHAVNGPACLEEAASAAQGSGTTLLAVTVLTSLDQPMLDAIGLAGSPESAARRLGRLAVESGIGGLVCSPHECRSLRDDLGAGVRLMVPGIRPAGSDSGDQRRIATPAEAIANGADLLVVGRPIRDADDPVEAARGVVREIADALERAGVR
jgi:orotidine-5'-phosphate decarboxylase